MKLDASSLRRETKQTIWQFQERSDVGVIVEQSWMFEEITKILKGGRLVFCFTIDKDILLWNRHVRDG